MMSQLTLLSDDPHGSLLQNSKDLSSKCGIVAIIMIYGRQVLSYLFFEIVLLLSQIWGSA